MATADFFRDRRLLRGEIARRIDTFSRDHNGLLRYEDMASLRLRVEATGPSSTDHLHTLVEALKLAYADRDTYYGDPAFAH